MNNKNIGDSGEKEICEKIKCPNCNSQLILLPPGFPLYDIQCSKCLFRAQVKTVQHAPSKSIRGAGWDIYEKVLKAGYLAPPLIINFKWQNKDGLHQDIRFFPFIARGNLKKYTLSEKAVRANYRMFHYVKLDMIPCMQLHRSLDPNQSLKKQQPKIDDDKAIDQLTTY